MPHRNDPPITGKTYHIFNKTIDQKQIFKPIEYCERMIELIKYYRSVHATTRFSYFIKLPNDEREALSQKISDQESFKIQIIAYCLMPNHFHLILRQEADGGISKFISDILNSLTRYYNTRARRLGPIFLPRFKSVHIKSYEQLVQISRYVHLNPFTSKLITLDRLEDYEWSSYPEYIQKRKGFCFKRLIMTKSNHERYRNFVLSGPESFSEADKSFL